jgi:hypothetical protein
LILRIFTITLSFIFLLSSLLYSQTETKLKFLVLGFQSKQMNDLEDRMLREELMRDLVKSGNNIVTVMELESAVYDENALLKNIRYFNEKTAIYLTKKFSAQYTVFGKIFPKAKVINSIAAGKIYKCSLRLYSVEKKKFIDISFDFTGEKKFYDFAVNFSKKCAKEISEKIKEN